MNPQQFTPSNMPNQPVIIGNDQTPNPGPAPMQSRKRLLLIAAAVAIVLVVIGVVALLMHKSDSDGSGSAVAISDKVADVSITMDGYVPQTVTVKQGQQVTFTNNDTMSRQLSADPKALPSFSTVEPLDQGDSYTYIFDQKGTYHYYDASDPTKFVGTITVQ